MGQRLVVNLVRDNEIIANSYFHWSGYTETALQMTGNIIANLQSMKDLKKANPLDIAIAAFAIPDYTPGFDSSERDYIEKNYTDRDISEIPFNNDRNEGLMAISKQGIDDSVSAGEMIVDIKIDDGTIVGEFVYPDESDEYGDDAMEVIELTKNPMDPMTYDEFYEFEEQLLDDDGRLKPGSFIYKGMVYYTVA